MLTSYLLQDMSPEDVKNSFLNNVFGCLRKPSEAESCYDHRSRATIQPLMKRARNGKVKTAVRCIHCYCARYRYNSILHLLRRFVLSH
ncbi:hypothetical protein PsorP6_004492 [Peronosclerospora sorghi]|uniref:Uncharacterized protein n=1 Tax=Peronosclerospora sorghi TaxID=230839 RepID=A0ACC0VPK8_9STRA|nr:hypothetical protein PsorP6_004492 [Peronosclerospora sorghi]